MDLNAGLARRLTIDGLQFHVQEYGGSPGATPLMCLHGGMAHTGFFDPLASRLVDVARPFSMDRRGHGNSEWTDKERYGFRRDVEDLEEVCAQLAPEPWVLIGHSQGGVLTVPTLLRSNLKFAGAVLLDIPFDPMAPEMRKTGDRLRRIPQIRYPSEAAAKRGFQPYPLPHQASEEMVAYLADRSFKPSGRGCGLSGSPMPAFSRVSPSNSNKSIARCSRSVAATPQFSRQRIMRRWFVVYRLVRV